jgi:hypothetical protein
MLLRYRADESVLDEIIGPEYITGQRAGIASQARDFFFEKPRSSQPPMFLAKYPTGRGVRERMAQA